MRRLGALAAAVTVLAVCSGGASPGHTAFAASEGVSWRVEKAPFRLVYIERGKQFTGQLPGGGMGYRLADGTIHRLTSVRTSERGRYTVDTDEPGRTATVQVHRTPRGLRVSLALQPSADVVQV